MSKPMSIPEIKQPGGLDTLQEEDEPEIDQTAAEGEDEVYPKRESDNNRKHVNISDVLEIKTLEEPQGSNTSLKKEKLALTAQSIMCLGRELGPYLTIKLCMYLNVPTTKIVRDTVLAYETEQDEVEMAANMLLYWRTMRAEAKESQKAKELERGLRLLNRDDFADIFMRAYKENFELITAIFPRRSKFNSENADNADDNDNDDMDGDMHEDMDIGDDADHEEKAF